MIIQVNETSSAGNRTEPELPGKKKKCKFHIDKTARGIKVQKRVNNRGIVGGREGAWNIGEHNQSDSVVQ